MPAVRFTTLTAAALVSQALLINPAWSQSAVDADTIDELKQIIQQQQQALEALQKRVEALDQTTATLSAQAPVSATPEEQRTLGLPEPRDAAGVISSGQDRIKLSISGQINRAALVTDDGQEKDYFFVDNDNSSTRFRFIGAGQVTDDFSIETALEMQVESNSTADVNQEKEQAGSSITTRRAEVRFKSKKFGTGYRGRGWTASDNSAEVDLSDTWVVTYSGVADMASGMKFREKGTNQLTSFNVFDMFDNLDGLGRDDRIRYDTPNFGGFSGAVSATTQANQWDAALNYAAELGSFELAAAAAYWKVNSKEDLNVPAFDDPGRKDGYDGSVSALHKSGLNLTLAGGKANAQRGGRDDQSYWYVKAGYIAEFFNIGSTAFSIDYWDGDSYVQNDSTSKSYSLAAVQNLEKYGTTFYAAIRRYDPDLKTRNLHSLDTAMLGVRVKF